MDLVEKNEQKSQIIMEAMKDEKKDFIVEAKVK